MTGYAGEDEYEDIDTYYKEDSRFRLPAAGRRE